MSCECTLRFEPGLDVGEHLPALGIEVVRTHRLAAVVGRHLTGNEEKLGSLHPGDVRILPQRFSQAVGVEDLDLGHRAPLARDHNDIAHRGKRVGML